MEPSSFFFNEWLEEGKIRELNGGRVVLKISFGRQATLGFPCGSAVKESARKAGDVGSTPGLKRSPGEGKGYPFQYSGLENSVDCIVHEVAESRDTTERLSHAIKRRIFSLPTTFPCSCWFWKLVIYLKWRDKRSLWNQQIILYNLKPTHKTQLRSISKWDFKKWHKSNLCYQ